MHSLLILVPAIGFVFFIWKKVSLKELCLITVPRCHIIHGLSDFRIEHIIWILRTYSLHVTSLYFFFSIYFHDENPFNENLFLRDMTVYIFQELSPEFAHISRFAEKQSWQAKLKSKAERQSWKAKITFSLILFRITHTYWHIHAAN